MGLEKFYVYSSKYILYQRNYYKHLLQVAFMRNDKSPSDDTEVRLAVSDLEGNFVGFKLDTCWTLSSKRYKTHSLGQSRIDDKGNLVESLLYGFNEYSKKFNQGWFTKFPDGIEVSVQELSSGDELFRYRVAKENEEYVAREI